MRELESECVSEVERQREREGETERVREREIDGHWAFRDENIDIEIFNIFLSIYAYANFLILFFHMADILSLFVS